MRIVGKTGVGVVALLLAGGGIWFGVRMLKKQVNDAATHPYRAPSGLVIAAVNSEYGARATFDGSILLEKPGAAAGLAGFYRAVPAGAFDRAIAAINEAKYTSLEAPKEPCRSDADSSTTTLGELTFPDQKVVTLWTCTLTKGKHAYFLAWATSSNDARPQLSYQLKTSQLVSNKLCAVNVINGGCSPDPSALIAALVASARQPL